MGLADRDYYRSASRGATFPALPGRAAGGWLSVNTCLIALCIAVFIIDLQLPLRYVPTGHRQWLVDEARLLDPSQVQSGPYYQSLGQNRGLQSLHERTSGNVIGWQEVMPMHWLTAYLHFSTRLAGFEFWRFLGFQFLHANLMHLVFNMLGLFFFGPIVEEYLGRKRYLAFYLLCGCCGALLYLLLNGIGYVVKLEFGTVAIPGLLFSDPSTPLVGASAGIFGVIMAGAFLVPNATAFYLFIPMRLQTLAYGIVALALFTLVTGGANAGGEAGHLGGAIAGFYFIRRPHHLHNFFDVLGRVDPTSHHYRGGRGGESHRASSGIPAPLSDAEISEVDRILDKMRTSGGVHGLTEAEKAALERATQRRRG